MRFRLLLLCSLAWVSPALAQPSSLDRLQADAIAAEDRKFLSIDGLVGFLRGHTRAVAAVAVSPDGKLLASSSWDNTVRIWRLGQEEPKEWATLEASPSGIAFHPDGRLLATGSPSTGVYLWDLSGEQPKRKHVLAGHKQRPFALAFSPTGRLLASGSYDPVLRIWKLEDDEPEMWAALANEKAPSRGIASIAISPNGKHLAAGSLIGRQTLRIWDASGGYLEELELPPAEARLVAFSPTEPVLAFAANDARIHFWRLAGGKVEPLSEVSRHEARGQPPAIKALAFSRTGGFATSGRDRRVIVSHDWKAPGPQRTYHLLDEVRALAFAPDGRHLVTGNDDGSLYVLRLKE